VRHPVGIHVTGPVVTGAEREVEMCLVDIPITLGTLDTTEAEATVGEEREGGTGAGAKIEEGEGLPQSAVAAPQDLLNIRNPPVEGINLDPDLRKSCSVLWFGRCYVHTKLVLGHYLVISESSSHK